MECRPYNDQLSTLRYKMIFYLENGVQSGLLVDGKGDSIYLFGCIPSAGAPLLPYHLVPHHDLAGQFMHPGVPAQIGAISNPMPAPLAAGATQQERNQHRLQYQLHMDQLDTVGFQHEYFQNMTVVPGHPTVCSRRVPFWTALNPAPDPLQHGPNILVDCIGDVGHVSPPAPTSPHTHCYK
ncbi:hypothetical protein SAMD00019534_038320 [Acytostelium subglobosum LB1]|uniref:hypothetical protein n=1 Tax=Acytostelium subglobosum LB1 TaxID=1410327 RepID=UPI00064520AC|nr:hypothetical protein SAMD00019534_038320 [Acytostelium subglobosum LB1]GAM20657.1 hypothetical protein SAMD00019534_038320 [Acytostelium subglobosum LB1]|eukprot:XP_012760178.1 hypothetical protein SAMD00019534_038320 [Acytostelium subglobosum LB1]